MNTITCQPDTTTVSCATVDGGTSGTASVPTTGSQADEALKTHLQTTIGWKVDDIVLEMYDPGKYVILFDTIASKFIREECSVAKATTDADKQTVQTELCAYVKRDHIRELDVDLNEIYSYYNISTICDDAFRDCTSLTTVAIPDSTTSIGSHAFDGCTSLTTVAIPDSVTAIGVCVFV